MAAPVFPPEYGGSRTFTREPEKADLSSTIGDLAALNLQLLHTIKESVAIPEDKKDHLNAVAEGLRQQCANAEATKIREKNTRVLRPLTRLPATGKWGDETNVSRVRLHNITPFNGRKDDPSEVTRWLGKVFAVARANGITFEAAKQLLIQGSDEEAGDYIAQLMDEGKTLPEMVQLLEMRYGALCSKEEARNKCNDMPRKEGESLSSFLCRLKHMARIACRYEEDETKRRSQIEALVVGNIRRVLPTSVRSSLEERILNRHRTGLPDFTVDELELECITLEQKRQERREDIKTRTVQGKRDKPVRYVNVATQQPEAETPTRRERRGKYVNVAAQESESELSEPELSSPEESESEGEDEGTIYLAQQVQREIKKFTSRGLRPDVKKAYKGAFKKFNERFQKPNNPKGYKPRQVGEVAQYQGQGPRQGQNYHPYPKGPQNQEQNHYPRAQQGPPKAMDPALGNRVKELLELANCIRGQCIQCGADGHHKGHDQCPLRGKPLVDKPCVVCGHGLHAADDCVMVYQNHPQKANRVSEQALNGM